MKTFILGVIATMLNLQLVCACDAQNDSLMYSCDPTVHKAVVANLPFVHRMERTVWLKLRQDFKRAVYRAFTPAQRKKLWMGKFAELKKLPWSKEELAHIKKVESFCKTNDDIYTDNKLTDAQINAIDLFFANWAKEAEEQLGWDKKIAISIVGTPCRTIDTKGTIELVKKGLVLKFKKDATFMVEDDDTMDVIDTTDYIGGGEIPDDTTSLSEAIDCHCADAVLQDFCIPLSCDSKWIKCNVTEKGCGWIWQKPCDGICH